MTENEAKEMLQAKLTCMNLEDLSCIEKGCSRNCDDCEYNYAQGTRGEQEEALSVAIKALEEIQQYRAIGTVEECREAMERQIGKKPYLWGDGLDDEGELIYDMYDCPNCGKSYEIDYEEYKHCPECGQAIDWSEVN